jgi:hypothetical protein
VQPDNRHVGGLAQPGEATGVPVSLPALDLAPELQGAYGERLAACHGVACADHVWRSPDLGLRGVGGISMFGVDGVLPRNGVPDMLSAAGDGPVVNVCGSWAARVSFPGLNRLLTSLALSGAPTGVTAAKRPPRRVLRRCGRASEHR